MHKRYRSGFTIVELLIAIVVIAVLAVISIVAFTGIQTRANNSSTQQGITSYLKVLSTYAHLNGGVYPAAGVGCLRDDKNNTDCLQVGTKAATCFGNGGRARNTTLDQAMNVTTSLPSVSSQTIQCGGQPYRGGYVSIDAGNKTGQLAGLFKGNITCPDAGGMKVTSRQQKDEATFCLYQLPSL